MKIEIEITSRDDVIFKAMIIDNDESYEGRGDTPYRALFDLVENMEAEDFWRED